MSDDKQEMITHPTIETVLERIQLLETRLENKLLQSANATVAHLEQLIEGLRAEMNKNFSRVRDEIGVLNDDTLKTRAGQRELLRRVEELETKAS